MDEDNGAPEAPGSMDVEGAFLRQFSRMGTTDKDELVNQLQKLIGSHLNFTTAVFFLDMNDWNLQAAVCSYLDVESPNQLPSMALMSDPVANEMESIEPNVNFKKTWRIMNSGNEQWPVGCYAKCSDGVNLSGNDVGVPCLRPGEGISLTVEMKSPTTPGIYQSKWRLCTSNGAYFGDPMWAIVTVVEEGTIELTNQMSHFNELGAHPPSMSNHNPFLPHGVHLENNQVCIQGVPETQDM
ncbi:unnamed protein product [Acanthoscelides obtectus]|uniref:Nbr1 FW domain-containing protein n=1 Tax=Acanthoscelides obtectus TaxID=200917 RepID=A0A9P0M5A5_ACAOB|nr:unnamed protein product [Acanthoscelides obtectus]CAK1661159.1 Uncharacterized protein C6orf106 homolog [Acanthoscelides obtectus]